ncbi:MAG TPA: ATP-grasp domain-containing protein [Deltaproteobacteria bacterium]|nr:ATP-grasp domain-containing protein [Deltaproteobacteria bacterium]
MAETLLIVGAGVEQVRAYRLAKEMGLRVVGTDMDPGAPAFEYADERIIASTRDVDETLREVRRYASSHPVDGVMTLANDVPLTVAAVAAELGLPGIPVESAALAADKAAMKRRFEEAGVATPEFMEPGSAADLDAAARRLGLPFVLKPADGRGARGVLLVGDDTDREWAWRTSLSFSQGGRLMAERFVRGRQISTESVVLGGRCLTPAFSDRNYEYLERYAPFVIENGGTMPALLTDGERRRIGDLVEGAARALGVDDCTVKGDIVLDEERGGEPLVIELALRLSGGYFATDQIPESVGVDLVALSIRLALGRKDGIGEDECLPRFERGAAIRFFFPPPGRIVSMEGADGLSTMAGVRLWGIYRRAGDVQPPIRSHADRAGFVLAGGATRREAVRNVERAMESVKFRVEPLKEDERGC